MRFGSPAGGAYLRHLEGVRLLGTGRKLLLADDSITIQKVVKLTFADEGLEVTTVSNGDLAVEKIEDLSPDIVLADIHMPGLNGYEVCEFVKRDERFRHIPVMLLVGSFEPFNEAEARRVGADDYLTKPFQSIRQLVSKVGALLSGKSTEDETPTLEVPVPVPSQPEAAGSGESLPPASASSNAPTSQPMFGKDIIDAPPVDFNDPSLDDGLIEATPAGEFNLNRTIGSAQRPTMPLSAAELEEAGINTNQSSSSRTFEEASAIYLQETLSMHTPEESSDSAPEAKLAPTTPLTNAATADDALLDLGEVEAQPAAAEPDDFVLDIWDDSPAQTAAIGQAIETSAPDKEAAAFDDETIMPAPAVVEYQGEVMDEAAPLPVAEFVEPEVIEAEPVIETAPPSQAGQIGLAQLSPEAIDAITRRAVEMLSEKVIEQIAWEVIPDLAERLIKRRLEEEQKR